jgi:hypothetical protein
VSRIDVLLVTHYHADHAGGVPELSQLLPIGTFVDHAKPLPEADKTVGGTRQIFEAYAAIGGRSRHLTPKPGDRLPLKGVDAVVVSSAGSVLSRPLPGAGERTPLCEAPSPSLSEPNENPRSTGIRLQFGTFRFLDLGDLTGDPLAHLICPVDMVGAVDVYLVAHHGNADSAVPATFAAFRPRVAVVNNGRTKGGAGDLFMALRQSPGLEDSWQLHRSDAAGPANLPAARIANLDDGTSHFIKLRAEADGSFDVTNGRTGEVVRYPAVAAQKPRRGF